MINFSQKSLMPFFHQTLQLYDARSTGNYCFFCSQGLSFNSDTQSFSDLLVLQKKITLVWLHFSRSDVTYKYPVNHFFSVFNRQCNYIVEPVVVVNVENTLHSRSQLILTGYFSFFSVSSSNGLTSTPLKPYSSPRQLFPTRTSLFEQTPKRGLTVSTADRQG